MFQNVGINFDGNVLNSYSTFLNSIIKRQITLWLVISHSYLDKHEN